MQRPVTRTGRRNTGERHEQDDKGALAAGLGVALLVCGGWTLAVWNTAVQTQGSTIASGDLKLTAGEGTRKNASGTIISKIAEYKVVPGDNLTFSQTVGVVLYESLLPAKFSVTGPTSNECLTALSKGGMSKVKSLTFGMALSGNDR